MCMRATLPSAEARSSVPSAVKEAPTAGVLVRTSPAGSHGATSWLPWDRSVTVDSPEKTTAAWSAAFPDWRPSASVPVKGFPMSLMGSFAPGKGWQRQRPFEGPLPGHSRVAPFAVATRSPPSSHAAAITGPEPATPSRENGVSSVGTSAAPPAAFAVTMAPRPCFESAMATGASSPPPLPGARQASTRGSKRGGHCTPARAGAPAANFGAVSAAAATSWELLSWPPAIS
mmetsp:Transcript_6124/g.19063  ORF Transcript_6124/g.19063 Transcript_6124/m.19063 type:complete len:230 (-) Transcript_6124:581-1270(-)